ncbi:MAG TPA: AAC(3) family N-acetyltransferase [Flavobacteriales bacterium]|nr:AAC(3) family N-acetyltransferase [Flavobacteriales bacterium]
MDVTTWPARCGVKQGMTVLLMADLTRMAWRARKARVTFTPGALLDAFLDAVGPSGTILVPTYNFDLQDGEPYDPARTPPITGALGVAALAHPAFRRTGHPLHSFAVAGAQAEVHVKADDASSFGPASVFALLRRERALQVVLDLPLNDALTYVHHVEELEGVSYRRWRTVRIRVQGDHGTTRTRTIRRFAKKPGHSNELHALEPLLLAAGALQQLSFDGATAMTVDLAAAHEVIAADIRTNGARHIHRFSWERWIRDILRPLLKRGPSRSAKALEPHAARPAR